MGLHTSGLSTSKSCRCVGFALLRAVHFQILTTSVFVLVSTLGGGYGIPRVHYKGRQGEYYIMVRTNPVFASPHLCV